MAITPILQVTEEGFVTSLSSFCRAGEVYLVWALRSATLLTELRWKKYAATYGTEIIGKVSAAFKDISAVYCPDGDALVVAYANSEGTTATQTEKNIYVVRFSAVTGAVLTGPILIGYGMKPSLVYRANAQGNDLLLAYGSGKRGSVYLRESLDGGKTWTGERPVLSNYVATTERLAVAPFDDEHLSIMQVGKGVKPLKELGSYKRTRPLSNIVKHPSIPSSYFVSEPTWYDSAYFTDYLRGALRLSRDGQHLYWSDGVRLGTNDGCNEVALVNLGAVNGLASSVHNSNVDGSLGDNLTEFTVFPFAAGRAVDCFGDPASIPVINDFDISDQYAYVAGTKEVAPKTNGGAFDVVRLSDFSSARVVAANSTTFFRAVSVATPPTGAPLIFVTTNESGQEKLRIYSESGLTPSLIATHKLPSYVNKILAIMDSPTSGRVYVSMVDRMNMYRVNGLTRPIRLELTIPLLSKGSFFQVVPTSNGYLVVAMGAAGIGIFNMSGGTVAYIRPSGAYAPTWRAGVVRTLGEFVVPTATNSYASNRTYFKCITAGTSGGPEPAWAPASFGNVTDGSAVWQEVGVVDSVITGVAIDETRGLICAVGNAGGPTSPNGRAYAIYAPGVILRLPAVKSVISSPAGGEYSTPQTVTLSCATPGASIYYTLDGSYPSASSIPYAPIFLDVDGTTQLRAVAVAPGKADSDPFEAMYTITFPQAATPTISPSGYQAGTGVTVTISCSESGVDLRYTVDGTTPTESSTLYTGPFSAPYSAVGSVTVKAIAFKYARRPSNVTSSLCYNTISPTNLQVHFDPSIVGGTDGTNVYNLVDGLRLFTANYQIWWQPTPIPNFYTIGNWDGWAGLLDSSGSAYRTPAMVGMYNSSYTIQIAVKLPYVDSDRWFFGTSSSAQTQQCLYFGTRSGKLYFGHHGADITGGPNISVNAWNIVHAVYDRSVQMGSLYLNGNLIVGPTSQLPLLSTGSLMMWRTLEARCPANIAHLAIYSRALPGSDVSTNFGILRGRFGL